MKKKLKCLIIGFGSIGKRHALNFYKNNCEIFIWSIKKKKFQEITNLYLVLINTSGCVIFALLVVPQTHIMNILSYV